MKTVTRPRLKGPTVTLRAPHAGDAEAFVALGGDPEISRMLAVGRDELTEFTIKEAREQIKWMAKRSYSWVIDVGRPIGSIGFQLRRRRTAAHWSAYMWIAIVDRTMLSKGFGTEATRLMLDFAFGSLGVHRVALNVLSFNQRAIRAYEKCGFVVEGRSREAAWIDGQWHDDLAMGILEGEYSLPANTRRSLILAQDRRTKDWQLIRLPSKRIVATSRRKRDALLPTALAGRIRRPATITVVKANGDYERRVELDRPGLG